MGALVGAIMLLALIAALYDLWRGRGPLWRRAATMALLVVPIGWAQLAIVPDLKAHVNVTYSFPTMWMNAEPYIMARFTHTGESVNSLAGIESSPFLSPVVNQDGWQTLDLQFGLESQNWAVSLFVDNLTDEKAQLFFNNRFAQQRLSVKQPRTFGINFRYMRGVN